MISNSNYAYRRTMNGLMLGASVLCAALCIAILLYIVVYIAIKGGAYLSVEFLTNTPRPLGEPGGGILNSIVGTAMMVGLATVIALPVGLGAGIFVAEYAGPRLGSIVRFLADVMAGIPSIVIGIFVYLLIVLRTGQFSGYAGAIALAVIMLPIIARSSEEMLKLVPTSQREAALALGIPQWRAIVSVVIPAAMRGLLTGSLLAIARAAGETAPLLFTSLGNRFLSFDMTREMDALPLRVFRYAIGPYEEWHQQAWAAALVLILFVLSFNILARFIAGRQRGV
jgi:phosphate transport system permease protein